MTPLAAPLAALLAFAAWTILLVLAVGGARVAQVLSGAAKVNEFTSGVPHGGDTYWRLNRAHLNCLEFLPIFAAVVLVGAVSGLQDVGFDRMAWIVPAARVGQSLAHISSGSAMAVNVRFSFFLVQLVCVIGMGLRAAAIL